MSKRDKLDNLTVFIGLRAAHEILIKLTNKPESIHHLDQEADTYNDLSVELAEGNWNKKDLVEIKELAVDKCKRKLSKYEDLSDNKYSYIESIVDNIIKDLELR